MARRTLAIVILLAAGLAVFVVARAPGLLTVRRTADTTAAVPAAPRDSGGPTAAPVRPPEPGAGPARPPLTGAPAGLLIPVQGVGPEELVDTFDDARAQGRVHDAIDILAPKDTPVLAAADGRIVELFDSEKGGHTIYQRAPDGRTIYYYAHLDRYAAGLREGADVRRGTVIAYVGDTGNAAPGNYHLHFAIWVTADTTQYWDGAAVNPYPLLKPGP